MIGYRFQVTGDSFLAITVPCSLYPVPYLYIRIHISKCKCEPKARSNKYKSDKAQVTSYFYFLLLVTSYLLLTNAKLRFACGPERARTAYLLIANEMFYQLNYGPKISSQNAHFRSLQFIVHGKNCPSTTNYELITINLLKEGYNAGNLPAPGKISQVGEIIYLVRCFSLV